MKTHNFALGSALLALLALSPCIGQVKYPYFQPGGALSCSGTCASQTVNLTATGSLIGPLPVSVGGTGASSVTGLVLGNGGVTPFSAYPGATCTNQFLRTLSASGTGTCNTVQNTDLANSSITVNGTAIALGASANIALVAANFANPSGLIGLTAVNGTALTADRSDSTHALDQSIAPTWTGLHRFSGNAVIDQPTSSAGYGILELDDQTPGRKFQAVYIGTAATPVYGAAAGSVVLDTSGSVPLGLSTADTLRMLFSTTGNIVVSTPSSGVAMTINGLSGAQTLIVNGGLNQNAGEFVGANSAGGSFGPVIIAGTNSSDQSLVVQNRAGTANYMVVRGDGQTAIGPTANSMIVSTAGAVTIAAPGSTAEALAVAGANNNNTVHLTGGATSGQSFGELIDAGSTSADYAFLLRSGNTATTFFKVAGNGVLFAPSLATSSAGTTGTLCWTTGTGLINVDTTTTCLLSSLRYKQAVQDLDGGLSQLMKLRPVSYQLKPEFDPDHLGRQLGLIAEEVARVDPRLVALDTLGTPKGVRYQQLTALLTLSIQQQQREIDLLIAAFIVSFLFSLWALTRARRRFP